MKKITSLTLAAVIASSVAAPAAFARGGGAGGGEGSAQLSKLHAKYEALRAGKSSTLTKKEQARLDARKANASN